MRCCEHNFGFNYPNDTLNKLSEEQQELGEMEMGNGAGKLREKW